MVAATQQEKFALHRVRRAFVYVPDRFGLTGWRILPSPYETGHKIEGDCEDFALTLAYELHDRLLVRFLLANLLFRTVVWVGFTANGRPHAALRHRGLWADNIFPVWSKSPSPHKMIFPVWGPFLWLFLLLGQLGRVFRR